MKPTQWLLPWLICASAGLLAGPAMAEGLQLPPIEDPVTAKECSACHIAFPPQMLPTRSWTAILSDLGKHFGEDASVSDQDRTAIVAYLAAHAADAKGTAGGATFLRGVAETATPLRITEMPFWRRRHSEISAASFKAPQVKSPANCAACHEAAGQGYFGEIE